MAIRVGEIGKRFRYGTSFDLSSSTVLTLNITSPDGTVLTKTTPDVTAPNVTVVEPSPVGQLLANTYMEFTTISTDFDQAGVYCVCGIYEDGTPNRFVGSPVSFTVEVGC